MLPIDDQDILKQIVKGDQKALGLLYQQYSAKVYNTAIGYLQNTEEAEELLQDVFVTIFEKADTFQEKSSVSTWIYRIAVNKSLDFLRKRKAVKRQVVVKSIYRKDSLEPIPTAVEFNHPGIKLENKEKGAILFSAIKQLGENQQTAFVLTYVEGLPQAEVAEVMELTVKSVESLLQRAKANLREILEKDYPERVKTKKNTSK